MSLTLKQKMASASFRKQRADYYAYLANIIVASRGNTKLLTIFERDAQRFEGKDRGTLSALWVERLQANGANLAEAWQGTLPDDEVAIVRVAQEAGGSSAIETALSDIARNARLVDTIRSNALAVLLYGLIAVLIMAAVWTVFPVVAMEQLKKTFGFIPVEMWGSRSRWLLNYADGVGRWSIPVLIGVAGLISAIVWSINNWTGAARDWADRKVLLWRAVRDVKGALFLSAMSTMTRRRGNVMFTLSESLRTFAKSVRSPWLSWRVNEVLEGVDLTGGTNTDAFKTNLISQEMYFYLRDMQEALGFADGFQATGTYIESHVVERIVKQLTFYRWLMVGIAMLFVLFMVAMVFSSLTELKDAMKIYMS